MADEKQVSSSFTSMAGDASDVEAPELGIGMIDRISADRRSQ